MSQCYNNNDNDNNNIFIIRNHIQWYEICSEVQYICVPCHTSRYTHSELMFLHPCNN